jgi:hypothetical protein
MTIIGGRRKQRYDKILLNSEQNLLAKLRHFNLAVEIGFTTKAWHARGTRSAGAPETIRTTDLCRRSFHKPSDQ